MTPTPKLRWAQRKYKLGPFYRDQHGNEAESEYSVLQQWWTSSTNVLFGNEKEPYGEWRDVPLEAE